MEATKPELLAANARAGDIILRRILSLSAESPCADDDPGAPGDRRTVATAASAARCLPHRPGWAANGFAVNASAANDTDNAIQVLAARRTKTAASAAGCLPRRPGWSASGFAVNVSAANDTDKAIQVLAARRTKPDTGFGSGSLTCGAQSPGSPHLSRTPDWP